MQTIAVGVVVVAVIDVVAVVITFVLMDQT